MFTVTLIDWQTHFITGTGDPTSNLAAPPGTQFWAEDTQSLFLKIKGTDSSGWVVITQA